MTTLDEVEDAIMAAGDARANDAANERERAIECRAHGEARKAELASGNAWALRKEADGLWAAAAIVRRMADREPTNSERRVKR